MSDLNERIEAVQIWLNDLQRNRTADPGKFNSAEAVLGEILDLIHAGNPRTPSEHAISETYADLERRLQEYPTACG